MLYQPVIRLRLADLAKGGDVRPSGEALFLDGGGPRPLGAGPEVAEGLARGVDTSLWTGAWTWTGPSCSPRGRGLWLTASEARQAARGAGQNGALVRT